MSTEINYDNSSIIYRLEKFLKFHEIDSKKLFLLLKENNAYLSGSFLLQTICDKYFDTYDLDIFVFNKNRNKIFEQQIHKLLPDLENKYYYEFYNFNRDQEKKFNEMLCREGKQNINMQIYPIMGIESVSSLSASPQHNSLKLRTIQIIYINSEHFSDMKKFVDNYDLDICSNYYDGENLYIKNLDGIINKYAEFRLNNIMTKEEINANYQYLIDNAYKYHLTTKQINYIKNLNEFSLSQRNLSRLIKYCKRGFDIKIIFGDDKIYDLVNKVDKNKNSNVLIILNELNKNYFFKIINNLPSFTENLLVYYKSNGEMVLDLDKINLPPTLKEIRFFSIECYNTEKIKLPFGCILYFNNQKVN